MRPEKQLLLDEIKQKIDQSTALVLTRYQKMNPNQASDFRMRLAKAGGNFAVVRKRILLKAAATSGVTLDLNALEGHIGVVFAMQDPIPVTKGIYDFAKENEEMLEVLGGRFEGKECSAKDFELISKLPTQDGMRAQLLGLFEAPMALTLSVMEAFVERAGQGVEDTSSTNS
jgi:large subunit ribosomal protein L10